MKDVIISELRRCASIPGKVRTWIDRDLNDEQLFSIYLKFRNEESSKAIARHVKSHWGLRPSSSIHATAQGLEKYRKRVSHLLVNLPSAHSNLPASKDLDGIDELHAAEGLEKIYHAQLRRVSTLMEEEQTLGLRHRNLAKELQILSTLFKTVIKGRESELMFGNTDPLRSRKWARKKQRIQRGFRALLEDIGPDGQDRLIQASKKLMEDLERHAVEVEVGADGNFKLVKPDESPNDNHTQ